MTFYYDGERESSAIVHVEILDTILKVTVDLEHLPQPKGKEGFEVVVIFTIQNFNSSKTFFTDSNGLQMQKRVLNHRNGYSLADNYYKHHYTRQQMNNADFVSNVTHNFYPVNYAIQLRDTTANKMFTVMNDRSQGGTSLKDG